MCQIRLTTLRSKEKFAWHGKLKDCRRQPLLNESINDSKTWIWNTYQQTKKIQKKKKKNQKKYIRKQYDNFMQTWNIFQNETLCYNKCPIVSKIPSLYIYLSYLWKLKLHVRDNRFTKMGKPIWVECYYTNLCTSCVVRECVYQWAKACAAYISRTASVLSTHGRLKSIPF